MNKVEPPVAEDPRDEAHVSPSGRGRGTRTRHRASSRSAAGFLPCLVAPFVRYGQPERDLDLDPIEVAGELCGKDVGVGAPLLPRKL